MYFTQRAIEVLKPDSVLLMALHLIILNEFVALYTILIGENDANLKWLSAYS